MRALKLLALLPFAALLGGCDFVVLAPAGDIAAQQRDLVVISTVLMLIIVLPVMALTVFFAWRYRQSNAAAPYEPEWDHSTQLELVIWSAPLLIIICLGALTWMGTHLLDPYRSLGRIAADKPIKSKDAPLNVEVVALDWKWLFIYPDYGVAAVNELAAPVDRPIRFRITASSVMNSFYIPALAGQIYAMPGMETKLHAVANKEGTYRGFSANYSGAGFSGMHFEFKSLSATDFDKWIGSAKASANMLGRTDYLQLERPSQNDPVRLYRSVDRDLYKAVLNMCVEPGKMCMSEMMAIDAKGGLGREGFNNTLPLTYDKYARRGAPLGSEPTFVAGICSMDEIKDAPSREVTAPLDLTPLRGFGLKRPPFSPAHPSSTSLLLGQRPKSES
ncbi:MULTISPECIES: ubiquinol oxidase subunit II [Bradyrhizobium]|uniref:ubiquinol oxidase subunit II n=1 Tax=Bradyrhizobium TaxID=374 RepID=UPI0004853752|nr:MULTISPECIES: ubiquinol oxidase subunit II [Bradyrhizobium]MDI2056974.1 ubiquinol oxidase subunit II [Bradyrhizobium sp. Mp19]MDI2106477.1 ubiquinol oxidase subunit II [Bradyrhizobium sp. Mp64]WLB00667.1 ubiquinol oxidase subunit II [Bradyrhizobium elkanii]WLC07733.1 ubiquinol oxidase subunit II [Bradyrhizobium elkanii USDA 94]